jgi:hypothetical protein
MQRLCPVQGLPGEGGATGTADARIRTAAVRGAAGTGASGGRDGDALLFPP